MEEDRQLCTNVREVFYRSSNLVGFSSVPWGRVSGFYQPLGHVSPGQWVGRVEESIRGSIDHRLVVSRYDIVVEPLLWGDIGKRRCRAQGRGDCKSVHQDLDGMRAAHGVARAEFTCQVAGSIRVARDDPELDPSLNIVVIPRRRLNIGEGRGGGRRVAGQPVNRGDHEFDELGAVHWIIRAVIVRHVDDSVIHELLNRVEEPRLAGNIPECPIAGGSANRHLCPVGTGDGGCSVMIVDDGARGTVGAVLAVDAVVDGEGAAVAAGDGGRSVVIVDDGARGTVGAVLAVTGHDGETENHSHCRAHEITHTSSPLSVASISRNIPRYPGNLINPFPPKFYIGRILSYTTSLTGLSCRTLNKG